MRNSLNKSISTSIAEQYGASIKMLENIVQNCEVELWEDTNREPIISQIIYHSLFFLDYYLSKNKTEREAFKGRLGDDKMGERTDGMLWDKIYTRAELQEYISFIREKAKKRFDELSLEELNSQSVFEWHGSSILSSLLYNLRHVMLHVGALHVRLNAVAREPQKWVSKHLIA